MISFRCPFCEVLLQVDDSKADMDIPCPNCQQEIAVPPLDSSAHVDDPPQSADPVGPEKVRIAEIAPAKSTAGLKFMLVVMAATIAVFLGIWNADVPIKHFQQKPPDYAAMGYSEEIDGVRFKLCAEPQTIPRDSRFRIVVGFQCDNLVTERVFDFEKTHGFNLRVLGMNDKEVPPTVTRPDFKPAGLLNCSFYGHSSGFCPLRFWPLESTCEEVNGKIIRYGIHTIDLCSRAWDLPPGKYKLLVTLKSLPAAMRQAHPQWEAPARYWSGSVTMPPLEVEVVPSPTTRGSSSKDQRFTVVH